MINEVSGDQIPSVNEDRHLGIHLEHICHGSGLYVQYCLMHTAMVFHPVTLSYSASCCLPAAQKPIP